MKEHREAKQGRAEREEVGRTKWRMACGIGSLLLIMGAGPALAQEEEEEIYELSAFAVNAQAYDGYRAVNSVGGTRFRVPVAEIPLPIQIMTQELMEDTASYTVADAIQYAAGVRRSGSSTNDFNEEFNIRGFTSAFNLRNGFRVEGVTDTANISHIEVIKGPSSVLYGAAEPGGLLNFVTKRPLFEPGGSVSYAYGTDSFNRAMYDAYGPIGKSGQFAYRLIGTYTNAESDTFWALEKTFLAPSLEWRINKNMRLGIEYEYLNRNQDGLRKRGFIGVIRGIDVPGFERPQEIWDPEIGPDFDLQRNAFKDGEQSFGVIDFEWNVTDRITFRAVYQDNWAKARIYKLDGLGRPFESGGERPVRGPRRLIDELNGFAYKADLLFDFGLGNFGDHQLLIGFEVNRDSFKENERRWDNGTLEPFGLGPDQIKDLDAVRVATENFTSESKLWPATFNEASLYPDVSVEGGSENLDSLLITDKVTLMDERLHLLLGLRYDELEGDEVDFQDGTRTPSPSEEETTLQFGSVYDLTNSLGLFANFSESFQPNGFGADGEALPPQTGEGIDIGLKFGGEFLGRRISGNIAWFDINRQNIPRTITLPPDFVEEETLLSGEESSDGIDFDLIVDLSDNWQVLIAGSYMDARVVENAEDPLLEGKQNVDAPEEQLRMFTRYTFTEGLTSGLTIGGGFHYEESTPTESRSTRFLRRTDSHTVYDLFLTYKFMVQDYDAEFQLNVKNVTDKLYIARSQQWGDPREFRVSLKLNF